MVQQVDLLSQAWASTRGVGNCSLTCPVEDVVASTVQSCAGGLTVRKQETNSAVTSKYLLSQAVSQDTTGYAFPCPEYDLTHRETGECKGHDEAPAPESCDLQNHFS